MKNLAFATIAALVVTGCSNGAGTAVSPQTVNHSVARLPFANVRRNAAGGLDLLDRNGARVGVTVPSTTGLGLSFTDGSRHGIQYATGRLVADAKPREWTAHTSRSAVLAQVNGTSLDLTVKAGANFEMHRSVAIPQASASSTARKTRCFSDGTVALLAGLVDAAVEDMVDIIGYPIPDVSYGETIVVDPDAVSIALDAIQADNPSDYAQLQLDTAVFLIAGSILTDGISDC